MLEDTNSHDGAHIKENREMFMPLSFLFQDLNENALCKLESDHIDVDLTLWFNLYTSKEEKIIFACLQSFTLSAFVPYKTRKYETDCIRP